MFGSDEPAAFADELVDAHQRGHLTRGRRGLIGFVEEVEAGARESVVLQGDERFAVRLLMNLKATVERDS